MKRLFFLSLALLFMVMMLGINVRDANAGCCTGCIVPGVYTCASWIKGSVVGNGHSKSEFDTKGCSENGNCPEHRHGIFGSIDVNGETCNPFPIDENGNPANGCYFDLYYYCVAKQCADFIDGSWQLKDPLKVNCKNQIESADPQSAHTQDAGGLVQDSEDLSCEKHNCKSASTTVTFEFGTFNLYCPSGQVPVLVTLDSFSGFLEFCEAGRDYNTGECCRQSNPNGYGVGENKCIDLYGDSCSALLVYGSCPEGSYDADDFVKRRTVEEVCSGGAELLPGEEYLCQAIEEVFPEE